ncbi:DUF4363 family protein [Lutispora sp.]|uniref:DUF4363 family protein n=1 Tax=Lutispora sp. TaxID=2828727 RepID=UPI00356ACD3D
MISNKRITLGLIGLVVLIFVAYFLILQLSLSSTKNVPELLNSISSSAIDGDWQKASQLNSELNDVWKKNEYLIMINYSEAEFSVFEQTIARLEAAVKQNEEYETVKEAADALSLWQSFGKLVPKP